MVQTRDVNETLRSETETRPRRSASSPRRDRDLPIFPEIETEIETFEFGSETRPRPFSRPWHVELHLNYLKFFASRRPKFFF